MTHSYRGMTTVFGSLQRGHAQLHLAGLAPAVPNFPTGPSPAFLITTTRSVLPSGG